MSWIHCAQVPWALRSKGWDKTEKLKVFTSYPAEGALCCFCGHKKQRLTGCLKSCRLTRWSPGKNEFQIMKWSTQQQLFSEPLSLGWPGYSSCVSFCFLSPLPLIAASFLYLTMSIPEQFPMPSSEPCCFSSLSSPKALANQNLSCSSQACVTFQTPQRIPVCSQGGESWHQRKEDIDKAK